MSHLTGKIDAESGKVGIFLWFMNSNNEVTVQHFVLTRNNKGRAASYPTTPLTDPQAFDLIC
jgi:hypothetical protein